MHRAIMGCAGVRALLPLISASKRLKRLILSDNNIENAGVQALVQCLKIHPSVEDVDLSNNPITTAGGKDLLELVKENCSICVLTLTGTSIHRLINNCIRTQLEKNARSGKHTSYVEILRRLSCFQDLTESQLLILEEGLRVERFSAGHTIIRCGDLVPKLYIVTCGLVQRSQFGLAPFHITEGKCLEEDSFFGLTTSQAECVASTDVQTVVLSWFTYDSATGASSPTEQVFDLSTCGRAHGDLSFHGPSQQLSSRSGHSSFSGACSGDSNKPASFLDGLTSHSQLTLNDTWKPMTAALAPQFSDDASSKGGLSMVHPASGASSSQAAAPGIPTENHAYLDLWMLETDSMVPMGAVKKPKPKDGRKQRSLEEVGWRRGSAERRVSQGSVKSGVEHKPGHDQKRVSILAGAQLARDPSQGSTLHAVMQAADKVAGQVSKGDVDACQGGAVKDAATYGSQPSSAGPSGGDKEAASKEIGEIKGHVQARGSDSRVTTSPTGPSSAHAPSAHHVCGEAGPVAAPPAATGAPAAAATRSAATAAAEAAVPAAAATAAEAGHSAASLRANSLSSESSQPDPKSQPRRLVSPHISDASLSPRLASPRVNGQRTRALKSARGDPQTPRRNIAGMLSKSLKDALGGPLGSPAADKQRPPNSHKYGVSSPSSTRSGEDCSEPGSESVVDTETLGGGVSGEPSRDPTIVQEEGSPTSPLLNSQIHKYGRLARSPSKNFESLASGMSDATTSKSEQSSSSSWRENSSSSQQLSNVASSAALTNRNPVLELDDLGLSMLEVKAAGATALVPFGVSEAPKTLPSRVPQAWGGGGALEDLNLDCVDLTLSNSNSHLAVAAVGPAHVGPPPKASSLGHRGPKHDAALKSPLSVAARHPASLAVAAAATAALAASALELQAEPVTPVSFFATTTSLPTTPTSPIPGFPESVSVPHSLVVEYGSMSSIAPANRLSDDSTKASPCDDTLTHVSWASEESCALEFSSGVSDCEIQSALQELANEVSHALATGSRGALPGLTARALRLGRMAAVSAKGSSRRNTPVASAPEHNLSSAATSASLDSEAHAGTPKNTDRAPECGAASADSQAVNAATEASENALADEAAFTPDTAHPIPAFAAPSMSTSPPAAVFAAAEVSTPKEPPAAVLMAVEASASAGTSRAPAAQTWQRKPVAGAQWQWAQHLQIIDKPETDRRLLLDVFQDECVFGLSMNQYKQMCFYVNLMRKETFHYGDVIVQQAKGAAPKGTDRLYIVLDGQQVVQTSELEAGEDAEPTPVIGEFEIMNNLPFQSTVQVTSERLVAYSLERRVYKRLTAISRRRDNTFLNFLRDEVPVLQDLSRKEVIALGRCLKATSLLEGEVLLTKGQAGLNAVYIIRNGSVVVEGESPGERSEFGEGELLGELEYHFGCPAVATVRGKEDTCLLAVSYENWRPFVETLLEPERVPSEGPSAQYYIRRSLSTSLLGLADPANTCMDRFRFGDPDDTGSPVRRIRTLKRTQSPSSNSLSSNSSLGSSVDTGNSSTSSGATGDAKSFSPTLLAFLGQPSGRRRFALSSEREGVLSRREKEKKEKAASRGQARSPRSSTSPRSSPILPRAMSSNTFAPSNAHTRVLKQALLSCFLTRSLDRILLDQLIRGMLFMQYDAGATILRHGVSSPAGGALHVVLEGSCSEFRARPGSVISTKTQGAVFGVQGLMFNMQPDTTVKANTDVTVGLLGQQQYKALLKDHYHQLRQRRLAILKSVPYLKDLSLDALGRLVDGLVTYTYPKGSPLIRVGDRRTSLFLILEGTVTKSEPGVSYRPGTKLEFHVGEAVGLWEFILDGKSDEAYSAKTQVSVAVLEPYTFEDCIESIQDLREKNKAMISEAGVSERRLDPGRAPREQPAVGTRDWVRETIINEGIFDIPEDRRWQAAEIAEGMEVVSFRKGEWVMHPFGQNQGKPKFYLIKSGSCQLSADGKVLDIVHSGGALGEIELLRGVPPRHEALVVSDELEAYMILHSTLNGILKKTQQTAHSKQQSNTTSPVRRQSSATHALGGSITQTANRKASFSFGSPGRQGSFTSTTSGRHGSVTSVFSSARHASPSLISSDRHGSLSLVSSGKQESLTLSPSSRGGSATLSPKGRHGSLGSSGRHGSLPSSNMGASNTPSPLRRSLTLNRRHGSLGLSQW